MDTKICTKCKIEKSIDSFSSKGRYCKECKKIEGKKYRENNKERISLYLRIWQQNNKDKVKIRNKKWADKNKDKVNAKQKRWAENNKDKIKKQDPSVSARWRKNNPDRAKEVVKKYRNSNPEKIREATRKRRMLRKQVQGENFTEAQWKKLLEFYGNKCIAPGEHGGEIQRDHVIPITKGGSDSIDNIQPLCRLHNIRKSNKTIDYRDSYNTKS